MRYVYAIVAMVLLAALLTFPFVILVQWIDVSFQVKAVGEIPSTTEPLTTKKSERYYQETWAKANFPGSEVEYILPERSRVDILTEEYAIEVDFAGKYAEAIGQSIYYGIMTGRKPGILLVLNKPGDVKFLHRLNHCITEAELGIRVWILTDF